MYFCYTSVGVRHDPSVCLDCMCETGNTLQPVKTHSLHLRMCTDLNLQRL